MQPTTTKPRPLDVARELDEVVGRYEPHAHERFLARYGKWVGRAVIAACLAMVAMVLIVGTLDRNMREAQKQARTNAAKRPVPVTIIPAK